VKRASFFIFLAFVICSWHVVEPDLNFMEYWQASCFVVSSGGLTEFLPISSNRNNLGLFLPILMERRWFIV
jgi:hypothetical protein